MPINENGLQTLGSDESSLIENNEGNYLILILI